MSLKEIARMAGVSPSTASRVLNDRPGSASEAVKERVWAAARAIQYAPNDWARSLRAGDAQDRARPRVAVVLARIRALGDDPFFAELCRSVEVELFKQGAQLTGIVHARDALPDFETPDGLLILGRCSEALLARLKAKTHNLVGLWRNPHDFNVDEVVCDGEKAAALAIGHLIALGHKKIAYIGDCSYERRYVGYAQALLRAGLPLDYALVKPTDQLHASGAEAMREIYAEGAATAVLCANDITAVGALEALLEVKGRVRRPIAVIAIDNVEAAQQTRPLLTTVDIPRAHMAHMAVLLLLDRIRGGHREHTRVELPCRIVERESCFPAQ